jgi:hypothetical protein
MIKNSARLKDDKKVLNVKFMGQEKKDCDNREESLSLDQNY